MAAIQLLLSTGGASTSGGGGNHAQDQKVPSTGLPIRLGETSWRVGNRHTDCSSMHETMRQTLEAFHAEFRDRAKSLDASEYVPAGEDPL